MAVARQLISPQEYLERERIAETKSEYYAGQVYAMAGGTFDHGLIAANIVGELRARLKGTPCQVQGSDLRIKVDATGLYTYPDASIVCGDPVFDDPHADTLVNPVVIFEVVSESTEHYDRGKKFEHYRRIASLRQYVIVSQHRPHIDYYTLNSDGDWIVGEADGLSGAVPLAVTDAELPLAEVYDRIDFGTNGDVLHETR